MKKVIGILGLVGIASFAAADAGESNWSLRFGLLFPRVSGLSVDTGASFSVAYRAYNTNQASIEIESLGSAFRVSDGTASADASISNLNVLLLAKAPASQFYGGGFVGITKASLSDGSITVTGSTKSVTGLVLGTKLSKNWFAEARYAFSDIPASRGTFLLAGYRF